MSTAAAAALPPGFRFHPTDEELILHYLRNRAASAPCPVPIIADVDIYKFDPWDLPCQAVYGEQEWYFFSPRDRKYPNGIRPNRAAGSGYWKATGTDKPIHDGAAVVGVKKALVFYKGRPPRGSKTSWIMHEYRLSAADPLSSSSSSAGNGVVNAYKPIKFRNVSMRLDDWVLCRIYKKSGLQASPMVPPLADYDHMDHHSGGNNNDDDGLSFSGSGGGFVVDADAACSSFLYAPSSTTTCRTTMAPRLPAIPSMSELFDNYALAQLFDATAAAAAPDDDHLAVHPSLNQLLSVGDGHDAYAEYLSSPSPAITSGSAGKRKAACQEDQRAGAAKRLVNGLSCFDNVPPQSVSAASGLQAAVLGAGLSSHQMLPQF